MDYTPGDFESKWKQYWKDNQIYKVENDTSKPKFYVLDMFPYPSGAGLHVGHPLGYIASDIFARYKRLNGFNVLHPMGYDAFGLPAEQYAVQMGVHPAVSTAENIERYRAQMDNIGLSFDWSRQVTTSDPAYYKWTQWIFLKIFSHYYDNEANKAMPIEALVERFAKEGNLSVDAANSYEGTFSADDWNGMSAKQKDDVLTEYRLAYRRVSYVNWCEALGTVLANDEVKDGVSERGGHPVERRAMLQWSLRITAYAERLLSDLKDLEWSDALKAQQLNWIGRSEGAQLFFKIDGSDKEIEIFTTRPDTTYGATYMVLAPEHPLVAELTTPDKKEEVAKYLHYVNSRSERDRMADVKEVTGCAIGAFAINPFTNTKVPIWIGEYVLMDYGTGAIMAVPSDDARDNAFAKKFDLPIIDVVDKSKYPDASLSDKLGVMINSDFLNGMEVPDAITAALQQIDERGIGKRRINYKLRDANFSRQRYWGEPFPIMYDKEGIAHPVAEADLPLELPALENFKPTAGGKSPLARKEDWVNLANGMTRETDTMPGFAGSSWYFLRYMDANNDKEFASPDAINYWKEVDMYIGGTEHAVGHLMYSRFWHKFLYDKDLVPTSEPFKKLINQGMIQGVIEFLYLQKEKENGLSKFVCAGIVEKVGNLEAYAQIPIHINYVKSYGTPGSYINKESIDQFVDWRPEYKEAIFECGKGIYQKGVFTPKDGEEATDTHLVTKSEVGKMSKRYFNVVNPDDVVEQYGSDCFRMYEMFLGPIEQSKPWDTNGIDGVSKFLRKFWGMFFNKQNEFETDAAAPSSAELKILHNTIKRVRDDIERFSFNTCVSAFMIAVNELRKINCNNKEILTNLVILIAPFAPHMAEELWERLGNEPSVHKGEYPNFDEKHMLEAFIEYPISINGKMRTKASFASDASKEDMEKAALELEVVQKWTEGKTVRKVIVVPKRMINIVVS